MLKEYRVELDKFLDYQKSVDERVEQFKEKIAKAEQEVDELGKEYAKSFISGDTTSDSKLKELEKELAEDKKQLSLILEARDEDPKLRELANAVYNEFLELRDNKGEITRSLRSEVQKLEKELAEKKSKLNEKETMVKLEEKNLARERFNIIPYMDIGTREQNIISSVATNYDYAYYVRDFGNSIEV